MNTRLALHLIIAATVACTIGGGAKEAASATDKSTAMPSTASPTATGSAANGQDWTSNGATACDKYLTPDVVAAILLAPAGHVSPNGKQSCGFQGAYASIWITLKVQDIDVFRLEVPRIVGTNPLPGVGDDAYWNAAGAISAVKGHKRGCDMSVVGAPGGTRIHDEELGKKLGEICNKLFALP
jgi:hypothetical protein